MTVGDRVEVKGKLYKVLHIRSDGTVKLQGIRGKSVEIIYRMPVERIKEVDYDTRAKQDKR